jgi:DNA-binding response OmpR family regulator
MPDAVLPIGIILPACAVMSSLDDREEVMKCLTFGAIDYLVKPLRHNELRHIWTRVWWWRRVRYRSSRGRGAVERRFEMHAMASTSRNHAPHRTCVLHHYI